jgi:hypothetical protein
MFSEADRWDTSDLERWNGPPVVGLKLRGSPLVLGRASATSKSGLKSLDTVEKQKVKKTKRRKKQEVKQKSNGNKKRIQRFRSFFIVVLCWANRGSRIWTTPAGSTTPSPRTSTRPAVPSSFTTLRWPATVLSALLRTTWLVTNCPSNFLHPYYLDFSYTRSLIIGQCP